MATIPVNASDAVTVLAVTVNGQVNFDFDFRADEVADLKANFTRLDGSIIPLVGGVDFTASGLENPDGGTITLTTLLDSVVGEEMAIYRDTIIERLTDYIRDVFAADLNGEQDTIFMILQELARDIASAVKVNPGDTPPDLPYLLDQMQQAIEAAAVAVAAAQSQFHFSTRTLFAQANIPPVVQFVLVAGYSAAGDGGGSIYKRVALQPSHPGKVQTADGAWWEIVTPILDPRQFGAKADFNLLTDTGTDNSTAISDVLDAMGIMRIPISGSGVYGFSQQITKNHDFVHIEGKNLHCRFTGATGVGLVFGNNRTINATTTLTSNAINGQNLLGVASNAGIKAGDIIQLKSTKAWYNDARSDTDITSDGLGSVLAGSTTSAQLPATFASSVSVVGKWITFTTGAAAKYARQILTFDNTTKTVTFAALPAAVVAGDKYVIPQCTKGMTCRVSRLPAAGQIEIRDVLNDAYLVSNVDPTLIREAVTITAFTPYFPVIKGIKVSCVSTGNVQGMAVMRCAEPDIDVEEEGGRGTGVAVWKSHGGRVYVRGNSSNRTSLGYGCQIWECTDLVVCGVGWNNRRLVDISGDAPSVRCRVSGIRVDGGGLQDDAQAYWPGGTVENFGTGSHGAGHNTIYEDNHFEGVKYGIYERGRGAVVRNNVFGSKVEFPVYHSFGGRLLVHDNKCDAGVFSILAPADATDPQDIAGSVANAKAAYAECFVTLGPNLIQDEPSSEVIVRDNFVAVKRGLIGFETSGGSGRTLPNVNCYDNEVEFYAVGTGDVVGQYVKTLASSAANVVLAGGRHGPNRMRAATGWKAPVFAGANVLLSTGANVINEFRPNSYSVPMANNTAVAFQVGQNLKTKLRVSVSIEEDDTKYFDGWINKQPTTVVVQIAGAGYEVTAAVPTGGSGGTTLFQMHYFDGVFYLANRTGFVRTFNVHIDPMG